MIPTFHRKTGAGIGSAPEDALFLLAEFAEGGLLFRSLDEACDIASVHKDNEQGKKNAHGNRKMLLPMQELLLILQVDL